MNFLHIFQNACNVHFFLYRGGVPKKQKKFAVPRKSSKSVQKSLPQVSSKTPFHSDYGIKLKCIDCYNIVRVFIDLKQDFVESKIKRITYFV